jgi:hypothetical protein
MWKSDPLNSLPVGGNPSGSLLYTSAEPGTDAWERGCPAVEKLDTFRAGHKRGIGWPRAAASKSAGV